MNVRAGVTVKLAIALIFVVMCVSAALTFLGGPAAKWTEQAVWAQPFGNAQSMKVIDLTGDQHDELFVQNERSVAVYEPDGTNRFTIDLPEPLTTTLGDVDGNGAEDIVTFSDAGVEVLDGTGRTLWAHRPERLGDASRAAVVRFADGPQIILGDMDGRLVALDASGQERWRANLSSGDYIRGLDEALVGGERLLAAANHDGSVALFDATGAQRWSYRLSGALRRMRAFDLDGDQNSEIVAGGDAGRLVLLSAADGAELHSASLGQAITEAREVETDGSPSAREFVVGGKDGGVWADRADGSQLWSSSIGDKVTEIVSVDVDDDGADEVIVGDEAGSVALFEGRSGKRHNLDGSSSPVTRLEAGHLTGSDQLLVADASGVRLLALDKQGAPLWLSPLLIGGLLSLVIAGAAWFIATLPAKPTLRAAAVNQSVDGLQAQRIMLHESLADVERLRKAGEMPEQAYLLRLKELRGELAETEVALKTAGAPVRVETFRCPSCGGALPLGLDRCDYCGQVVIA